MEKLAMCRVCLVEDIPLNSIVETHLQEMYETLVSMPFETKDSRPKLVCYICYAKLQNCYELRRSCLRSEELFTQMLSCHELELVKLQEIKNKKRLTVVHNIVNLNMGHELQMNADNVGVEVLTFEVKIEQHDPDDIEEEAQDKNSVYEHVQSDWNNDPLIFVKEEQPRDRTSDVAPKDSKQAVQRNIDKLTSSYLKKREIDQDIFKELNQITAAKKTAANEVTFTLTNTDKERSTSILHHRNVQYTCGTCQKCYRSKYELEKHIRLCASVRKKDLSRENSTSNHTRTTLKPHQCNVCEKSFSCVSNLTRHTRMHTGEKLFQCDICKKRYSHRGHLISHIRTHSGEKPYHCDICKKQYSHKIGIYIHMRTHTGEKPYNCDICMKQFTRNSYLSNHMRIHTGEKPYQCDVCKKRYSQASGLITHMRTHTGEKPYQCRLCEKSFTLNCNLNRHVLSHTGEKPYSCDICKKKFSDAGHLPRHMRTHTGEKPYQCNVCKKSFSRPSHLKKHMRIHTGERSHQCDICNKCFSSVTTLSNHTLIHTGEKPLCHICNKQFSRKDTLDRHLLRHTGQKLYHCNICKKQFTLKNSLTNHMRTHTGEKPYQCDTCNKQFSLKSTLTNHLRTHW